MSYEIRKKVIQQIRRARTIAIFMHNAPDGDCIGSAFAMEEACKNIGKNVDVIIHNKISSKYEPLIGEKRTNRIIKPKEGKKYDLAILLDCADPNRTFFNIEKLCKQLIVIDHHPNKTSYGNIYLYENSCSTGAMIYRIIKQFTDVTPSIASYLYLAIASDTHFFRNHNTTQNSHQISSELIKKGANVRLITEILESKTREFFNLLSVVIPHMKVDRKKKITTLSITRDQIKSCKAFDSDAAMIIDYIKDINTTDVTLLFIEGITNIRIRARGKNTKVNEMLEHFGGGGHEKAAGCAIDSVDLKFIENEVTEYAKSYLEDKK